MFVSTRNGIAIDFKKWQDHMTGEYWQMAKNMTPALFEAAYFDFISYLRRKLNGYPVDKVLEELGYSTETYPIVLRDNHRVMNTWGMFHAMRYYLYGTIPLALSENLKANSNREIFVRPFHGEDDVMA